MWAAYRPLVDSHRATPSRSSLCDAQTTCAIDHHSSDSATSSGTQSAIKHRRHNTPLNQVNNRTLEKLRDWVWNQEQFFGRLTIVGSNKPWETVGKLNIVWLFEHSAPDLATYKHWNLLLRSCPAQYQVDAKVCRYWPGYDTIRYDNWLLARAVDCK